MHTVQVAKYHGSHSYAKHVEVHEQSNFSSENGTNDAWLALLNPLDVGSCERTEPVLTYHKTADIHVIDLFL